MNIEDFIKTVDESQLDKEIQQKRRYILGQKQQLTQEVDQKISTIISVKKRKLDYNAYSQAGQRLKRFLTSAKNLIGIYFDLLQDEEKMLLFNFSDLKDLVQKIRFCLFRSVHNMNRMLIKGIQTGGSQTQTTTISQSSQENQKSKKKKKKKGKNSKMTIEQTGCMYKWILQNFQNPYPSQQEKQKLSSDSKISISKVNYWFINMRERTLKKLMNRENSGINKKSKTDKESGQKQPDPFGQQQSQMLAESAQDSQNS